MRQVREKLAAVEGKLRQAVQEKTAVEATAANLEKELKHLRGQASVLTNKVEKGEAASASLRDARVGQERMEAELTRLRCVSCSAWGGGKRRSE